MKFIELFGMPASGKTHIIKNLEKNSRNKKKLNLFFAFDQRSIRTFFKKFFYLLTSSFLFFNFSFSKKIMFFFINVYKPKRSRKISLRTFSIFFNTLFLISIISICKNSKRDINIYLDQGFFQILFSILYEMNLRNKKQKHTLINDWLKILSQDNQKIYLIYCESNYSTIFDRLLTRKGDSIIEKNNIEKNDVKSYQNIFDNIIEVLICQKNNCPNIQLYRISSDSKINSLLNL